MNQDQLIIDKLTPVGFRVLVNIYKKPNQTSDGFALPEQENAGMPVLGQIAALGKKTLKERLLLGLGIKPRYQLGQWVYFRKYSVDELRISAPDGELTLFVLEEDEIIGLVDAYQKK